MQKLTSITPPTHPVENAATGIVVSDRAIPEVVPTPADMIRLATEQARVLVDLVEKQKLYSVISGRKYVRVEGWVPLARMNNVIPREVSNEAQADGRYIARVQLVRMSDGLVLTEASGECGGPDETVWGNRPAYARRSMAATRATGKACRLAFSWVMTLGGYEPTPAEEMDPEIPALPEAQASQKYTFAGQQSPYSLSDGAPNTYYTFYDKKTGAKRIGVIPGDIYDAATLESLGLQLWEKKGRYFAGKDATETDVQEIIRSLNTIAGKAGA